MSSISQKNATTAAPPSAGQPASPETEQETQGWTIISKPGAVVEISTRPLPDYIREAISRNLGIGTGIPNER